MILPNHTGMIISHDKDPKLNQPVFQWKVMFGFFRGSHVPSKN